MKKNKKLYIHILLKVFCLTICICLSVYVLLSIYIGSHVYEKSEENADVIVILGARTYFRTMINPCLLARIEEGVSLYKDGRAPTILVTGGNDGDGTNEADEMEKLLLKANIPQSHILKERASSSTFENMTFSYPLIYPLFTQKNRSNIILVSEPFHLPRAKMIAQSLGIEASVSPATNSPCWTRWKFLSRYFLLEPIKYVNDWVKLVVK